MAPTRCPKCEEELGKIEQVEGKCISCGAEFEKAPTASHGEPEDSPYHPSASIHEPLNARQWESVALLLAFLLTLATPLGMVYSCYVGFQRGDTLCAHSGCTQDATRKVEYTGGVTRGYCGEHAAEPDSSVSRKQRRFPIYMAIGAFLFLGYYLNAFREAYTGKVTPPKDPNKRPGDPFRHFVWATVAGVFLVNGLFWFGARYLC